MDAHQLVIKHRQKFVKHVNEEFIESEYVEPVSENVKTAEIVDSLEQKVKDLSQKCGILEFEKEVLEVKYEALENAKIARDDQVEEVYATNRQLL